MQPTNQNQGQQRQDSPTNAPAKKDEQATNPATGDAPRSDKTGSDKR